MEAGEHGEANITGMVERKKRKRERKKSEHDSCVGLQDTHSEPKLSFKTDNKAATNRTVANRNESKKLSTARDGRKDDVSEKADGKRKKKKRERKEDVEGDLSSLQQENLPENVEGNIVSTKCNEIAMKKLERKKKHKKEKDYKDHSSSVEQDITMKDSEDNGSYRTLHTDEIRNNEAEHATKGKKKKTKIVENGSNEMQDKEVEHSEKRKKRKTKIVENGSDEMQDNEVEYSKKGKKKKTKIMETGFDEMRNNEVEYFEKGKKKKITLVENGSNDHNPNKSNKKVRFSDEVEVFTLPDNSNSEIENNKEDNLVRGKRFTREEDEILKEAVFKYIQDHDLGDEGLNMVLNSKKYSKKLKGCWKEIASAIPYRPYVACYLRAQVLFRRSENRKWTQEEYDEIRKYQAEYGNQWRALADALGKHRWHVKDTWRRIKSPDLKKGAWSQNEYQKLFDLVNTDLQLKASEEKRSKHGMLRDNICWTAISDRLSTRSVATCCLKWYKQLTSPMVAEGVWADTDDYRLLGALYSLDATCIEDVEWDNLLDNRTGDVCRKRWNQMVLHIGGHGNKSFAEQVEVLAQRYCPHLLEAREAWDSKPRVP